MLRLLHLAFSIPRTKHTAVDLTQFSCTLDNIQCYRVPTNLSRPVCPSTVITTPELPVSNTDTVLPVPTPPPRVPVPSESAHVPPQPVISRDTIKPSQQDTLFWCIYIAVHGYNDYLEVDRNYGVKELSIKQKVAEFVQSSPERLKAYDTKLTKVAIQEILSELWTSQKETTLLATYALAAFYNIHLILLTPHKQLLLEYRNPSMVPDTTVILSKDTYGKYKLLTKSMTANDIEALRATHICMVNYQKALHPISKYSIDELRAMIIMVGGTVPDKCKKADLYKGVSNHCESVNEIRK